MKLSLDCLRAVMFYLEENLSISPDLEIKKISVYAIAKSLDYSLPEIANTLLILDEANFIVAVQDSGSNRIVELDVFRITYAGYQFLETIQSDSVWKKTQSICKSIGSFSIDVIVQVASGVITSMISSCLTGRLNP